jgi:hypothetical protein
MEGIATLANPAPMVTDPGFNPDNLRDVGILRGCAARDLTRAAGMIQ